MDPHVMGLEQREICSYPTLERAACVELYIIYSICLHGAGEQTAEFNWSLALDSSLDQIQPQADTKDDSCGYWLV